MSENIPRHIAIIMDGNGRWAIKHRLPRIEGHRKGAEAVKRVADACIEMGIPYLTLYVFSTENWNRPRSEVDGLFELMRQNLDAGLSLAMEKEVRIYHLGRTDGLPEDVKQKISEALELTRNNSKLNLVLAFNYGGRDEIINAVKNIIRNRLSAEDIDETILNNYLYSAGIPDPDLIIRSGGEKRLSNFLLWQSAYAEFYFTSVLWPDFDQAELEKAINDYRKRQRRFGRLPSDGVKS